MLASARTARPGAVPTEHGRPRGRAADRLGARSGVADIQRLRMIASIASLAREHGVAGVTVAHVVARSGVSRRTFYELFEDRDDCLRAAFEHGVARVSQRVVSEYEAADSWRERMRAGLAALIEFLDEEPDLGALCVVAALGASPVVLDGRAGIVDALVDAVAGGGEQARRGAVPTRLTAEGTVGAVLSVLHTRLTAGEPVAGLQGALMGMIVLPYLGLAAAAREASTGSAPLRLTTPSPRADRLSRGDPLRDLDMRLTYRTARVLFAIAANPGASNRRVADAADISDPGQISKLLARLMHLGLIRNGGAAAARGEPNVWSLTAKGEAVERVIRQ